MVEIVNSVAASNAAQSQTFPRVDAEAQVRKEEQKNALRQATAESAQNQLSRSERTPVSNVNSDNIAQESRSDPAGRRQENIVPVETRESEKSSVREFDEVRNSVEIQNNEAREIEPRSNETLLTEPVKNLNEISRDSFDELSREISARDALRGSSQVLPAKAGELLDISV